MLNSIDIKYEFTDNNFKASKLLESIKEDIIAVDFEVASKYTKKDKQLFNSRLSYKNISDEDYRINLQKYLSDGLSHPSMTLITHCNVAVSNDSAFVIICSNEALRRLVCNFLVTTDKLQLWHNCCFDFKHILHKVGKIPKNYVDTQLLAKTLLNDADSFKDRTGLKELMSYAYGEWSIAKDDLFNLENMYDPKLIKYAAIDACATYKLYEDIIGDLNVNT